MPQVRPTSKLGVQIVTLLDFNGPMLPHEIAKALLPEVPRGSQVTQETLVREAIDLLVRDGFVSLSRLKWAHWDSTGTFRPDRDRPMMPDGDTIWPPPISAVAHLPGIVP